MKKIIFFTVIISAAILVSVFFSRDIYRFYMITYYNIAGKNKKEMVSHAYKMFEAKEYKKLESYIFPLMIVYNDIEITRLAGMNYIKLGNRKKGADLITRTLESGERDIKYTQVALKILYEEGFYGDIKGLVEDNRLYSDYEILQYYGLSLYKLKLYKKAVKILHKVKIKGSSHDFNVNFYLGRSYEELKNYAKASVYLYAAYNDNPDDILIRKSLIRVYSKLGKYKEAEKFIKIK